VEEILLVARLIKAKRIVAAINERSSLTAQTPGTILSSILRASHSQVLVVKPEFS
jgi:hypothetical protein